MPRLAIREGKPEDEARVRTLAENAMTTAPEYVPDAPDDDLRDVERAYLDGPGTLLVGELDGTIVAMGAVKPLSGWMADQFTIPTDRAAELARVRIDRDHRRDGFATDICTELCARASDAGFEWGVLNTGVENRAARGLYETLGFDHRGTVTVEFGRHVLDLALYRTRLSD